MRRTIDSTTVKMRRIRQWIRMMVKVTTEASRSVAKIAPFLTGLRSVPTPSSRDMVLTRSQSQEENVREERDRQERIRLEEQRQLLSEQRKMMQQQQKSEEEEEVQEPVPDTRMETDTYPRAERPTIKVVTYKLPVAFDDIAVNDLRTIGNIAWFRRQAVIVDAESDFVSLDIYAWDGDL